MVSESPATPRSVIHRFEWSMASTVRTVVRNRAAVAVPVHGSRASASFPGQISVLNGPDMLSPVTVKVPDRSFDCVKTLSPETTPSAILDTRLNVELVTSTGPVTMLPFWVRPNTTTPLPWLMKSQVHVPTQSPVTLTVGG